MFHRGPPSSVIGNPSNLLEGLENGDHCGRGIPRDVHEKIFGSNWARSASELPRSTYAAVEADLWSRAAAFLLACALLRVAHIVIPRDMR